MDRSLSAGLVACGLLTGIASTWAQAPRQGSATVQTAEKPMADKTIVGLDPHQLPKIGAQYYPEESLRHQEQGTALVRLYAAADGSVPASQIVVSSGFVRLDAVSLTAWVDAKIRPAILHGQPISKWINVPTQWSINRPKDRRSLDASVTPQMSDNYQPKLGRAYYPKASLEMRQEGTCLVHFRVSEDGTPGDISITKSTGFATLDQACVSAIQDAQFTSARQDGKYVAAWTDILIAWHLPSSEVPP